MGKKGSGSVFRVPHAVRKEKNVILIISLYCLFVSGTLEGISEVVSKSNP